MEIPTEFKTSRALAYVIKKGWNWKPSDTERVQLETCPFCSKDGYGHFYMVADGTNRDGLYSCHKCGESGNLRDLYEQQKDTKELSSYIESKKEWAKGGQPEPAIDVEAAHEALLADTGGMDYVTNVRGWSIELVQKQKLGLVASRYFKGVGNVKALVYPYLSNGSLVFWHYRTMPPYDKAFSSATGWDAPLYNGEILRQGIHDVIMVEGEANVLTAMNYGIENVVGVPGANFKKAEWIGKLDELNLEHIYVQYDKDKTGNRAAQELATRIGCERCYKIVLPDFEVPDHEGTKPGKDLNEWFKYGGGTLEKFEQLKQEAQQFDVQGVSSVHDALDELEEILNGKEDLKPTYNTPWQSLNKLVGFEDGDVIDILAPEKIGKTTFGMNLLDYQVRQTGEDGMIICLEMDRIRLSRKWVCHLTNFDDSIPETDEEARTKLKGLREAIKTTKQIIGSREGDMYFCYPQYKTVDDVYQLMTDCIRRYGVKWIMLDNLQLLCDRTLRGENRTIHLSQISKSTAGIARDNRVKLIRILQPHRIAEGKIISTNNTDGASQIAKDCDCTITLWRKPLGEMTQKEYNEMEYTQSNQSFDNEMLVSVGLSRYSSGGYTKLYFNGATSSVFEYDAASILNFKEKAPKTGYASMVPVEKLDYKLL